MTTPTIRNTVPPGRRCIIWKAYRKHACWSCSNKRCADSTCGRRNLLEHLCDIRSLEWVLSFVRGDFFVLTQLWNSRRHVSASTWVADGLLPSDT